MIVFLRMRVCARVIITRRIEKNIVLVSVIIVRVLDCEHVPLLVKFLFLSPFETNKPLSDAQNRA